MSLKSLLVSIKKLLQRLLMEKVEKALVLLQ